MAKPDFQVNIVEICRAQNIIPPGLEPLFQRQADAKQKLTGLAERQIVNRDTFNALLKALDHTNAFSKFCKQLRASWNSASSKEKESYHLSEPFLLALEEFASANLAVCDSLKKHILPLSTQLEQKPALLSQLLDSSVFLFGLSVTTVQLIHKSFLDFESRKAYH